MLNNSVRERFEIFAALFIGLLILLYISSLFFIQTRLDFDISSARFRETKHFLSIPYHSSIRNTWLTQYSTDPTPAWNTVVTQWSSRPSVWHGVGGSFAARLRSLNYLNELDYLSTNSQIAISDELFNQLNNGEDTIDGLINARDWLDCFIDQIEFQGLDELIPDEDILSLINDCNGDLQD